MSAVASSSSSSFSSPLDFLLPGYLPPLGLSQPISHLQLQYSDNGRMLPFVETPSQRRERVAFVRKREKSRRVSAWIAEATQQRAQTALPPLDGHGGESTSTIRPETIAEEDESESYMVYSPSPFTSDNVRAHTSWSSALLAAQRPRRPNTGGSSSSRTSSSPSRHSSRSSLSSISEEGEEEEDIESP